MNSGRDFCCILSEVLGNRAFSSRLHEAITALTGGDVSTVRFSADTYHRFPAHRLTRIASEIEAESVFCGISRAIRCLTSAHIGSRGHRRVAIH
jgi:hypothetical protein